MIMTTEEKAKRYDEALERARMLNNGKDVDVEAGTTTCEYIFPELKESGGERIRKWLYDYISNCPNNNFDFYGGVGKDAVLNYLEKQKDAFENGRQLGIMQEQARQELELTDEKQKSDRMKPIYDARESFESALEKAWNDYHNGYENVDKLEDDYVECAHAKGFREGYLFGIEKQKEQKPIDKIEPKFKVGDTMRTLQEANDGYTDGMPVVVSIDNEYYQCTNELIAIKDQDDYEFPPINRRQKPAEWSEEDESYLQTVINEMETNKKEAREYEHKTYDTIISWLKSLPLNLKKKNEDVEKLCSNEWSKEDKNKLNHILEIVHIASGSEISVDEKEELESFLKSLCPQPKQEWSKEDEKIIYDAYYWLCEYAGFLTQKNQEKSSMIFKTADRLKSLRPQPRKKIYQAAKHDLAIRFMNYLDENRPEGKMSLSEGECGDIDKAFKENDWAKIMRHAEKYLIQSEQKPEGNV